MFTRVHPEQPQPAVYQVTRLGHEHCDIADGMLLDITPLDDAEGVKIFTLYDKDLTEGVNLLIGMLLAIIFLPSSSLYVLLVPT